MIRQGPNTAPLRLEGGKPGPNTKVVQVPGQARTAVPGQAKPGTATVPGSRPATAVPGQARPTVPTARPGTTAQKPAMARPNTPQPPKVTVNAPPKSLAPKKK